MLPLEPEEEQVETGREGDREKEKEGGRVCWSLVLVVDYLNGENAVLLWCVDVGL